MIHYHIPSSHVAAVTAQLPTRLCWGYVDEGQGWLAVDVIEAVASNVDIDAILMSLYGKNLVYYLASYRSGELVELQNANIDGGSSVSITTELLDGGGA